MKTHTIISRAAYMIEQGVAPENILLFTFTNKAANEIKERVVAKIGDAGRDITMGTYHSVCSRILRRYGHLIGFPASFAIYDAEDSMKVIKKLIEKINPTLEPKFVAPFISKCKMNLVSPSDALADAELKNGWAKDMAIIYGEYQDELFKLKSMDFDDIIWNTIKLLNTAPDVKRELNDKFKYVIADESHDSSYKDIELIELLSSDENNICFILDDQQAIYGFRGATLDAIMSVPKLYPNLKKYHLSRNYRSSNMIVTACEKLISRNSNTQDRKVYTENENGSEIAVLECSSQEHEALEIAKYISAIKRMTNCNYNDIAILFRMNYLSRPVEEALFRANIPYAIKGGSPFYSRLEIKDILSFVRLIYNPADYFAFARIVNIPKRGLGDKTVEKIYAYVRDMYPENPDFIDASSKIKLTKKATESLRNFNEMMNGFIECSGHMKPPELVEHIIAESGYIEYLKSIEKDASRLESRLENIDELIEMCYSYDSIAELMESISLFIESSEDDGADKVQLMTMHSSKGLEFDNVFVIGSNEDITPHKRSVQEGMLEEERRLYYVACTRAKKQLFITRHEFAFTQGRHTKQFPSRFISELDQSCVKYIETKIPEKRWA